MAEISSTAFPANVDHIDSILDKWKPLIGKDFAGYRNHVVRMANFCLMLVSCDPIQQQKIEIAACFHDIVLWTAGTWDYLTPSVPPALKYLEEHGQEDWAEEITQMILEHHKVRPVTNASSSLVELFRKGDLVDFSLGLVKFGLPASEIKAMKNAYPNAGFHKKLSKLAAKWFLKHPLNPAPMMKW